MKIVFMPRWMRLFSVLGLFLILNGAAIPGQANASRGMAADRQDAPPGELPGGSFPAGKNDNSQIAESAAGINLLFANQAGLSFQVDVPWDQLQLELVSEDAGQYTRVTLPGWGTTSTAGAPGLPFLVEQIGAPFGVEVRIEAEPGAAHRYKLAASPLPAASQQADWELPAVLAEEPSMPAPIQVVAEDPAIYQGRSPYPDELAGVTVDAQLRQQRIIGIAVYPIQYYPETQELVVYESMRVVVLFEGRPLNFIHTESPESSAYEEFFRQELLNYETAHDWRQPTVDLSAEIDGYADSKTDIQPWAPPVPGWRVKVRADGIYKLTYSELQDAELPVDILDPRTFKLFYLGEEAAIDVVGESDGSFDSEDCLIFYGQGVESKYTADNVYWLTYGTTNGLRAATRNVIPDEAETPVFYNASYHAEENHDYRSLAPGGDDLDRWMWSYILAPSQPSWTTSFSLTEIHPETAELTLSLLGYLKVPVNPDHHVVVNLNGTKVGEAWWDGLTWNTWKMSIEPGILQSGNNILELVCPNDTGFGYDFIYIDWFEITFPRSFKAEDDKLSFSYEETGNWKYEITGFSTDQLVIYDVSNPTALVRLEGVLPVPSGDGYSAQFQDQMVEAVSYWAMADVDATYQTVADIEPDIPSDLQSASTGADYLLLTHADFEDALADLRALRESQGLRTVQVDVQDVYDEFGYGIVGAAAIRDFLAYAYASWTPPVPTYVVLVGDGHYDPKDYSGYGRVSFIPPYLSPVDPELGETAADNRYVTTAGTDILPDMMLGRLAVNDASEASAFVDKIVGYEENPIPGEWQGQVLSIADDGDYAGNFSEISDDLLNSLLPSNYQADKVYFKVTHPSLELTRSAIQAGINSGKMFVNYIGHGSANQWANENLFSTRDIIGLSNGGMLPVFLPMTCADGYYIYPNVYSDVSGLEAVAEVATRVSGKGAVASWSPTGWGNVYGHDLLNRGFYKAYFKDALTLLGGLTEAGKLELWASGTNLDLIDTYLLFGDPAMRIPLLPPAPPTDLQAAALTPRWIELSWQDSLNGTEYRLERSPDGSSDWEQIAVIEAGVTGYSNTGLTCETPYFYRIRTYRPGDAQLSDYSNTASTVTLGCKQLFLPVIEAPWVPGDPS